MTDTIDTYQKQVVPNENIMATQNVKTSFVHNEYRGYEILEFVKPYVGTSQKLSFSADVKLSEPGELFFYTLGRYYINGCRREVYKINDTDWHRIKIEGTTVRYNPNE